jgi:hypothetical protein
MGIFLRGNKLESLTFQRDLGCLPKRVPNQGTRHYFAVGGMQCLLHASRRALPQHGLASRSRRLVAAPDSLRALITFYATFRSLKLNQPVLSCRT